VYVFVCFDVGLVKLMRVVAHGNVHRCANGFRIFEALCEVFSLVILLVPGGIGWLYWACGYIASDSGPEMYEVMLGEQCPMMAFASGHSGARAPEAGSVAAIFLTAVRIVHDKLL
jgi:hypothetical protein